MNIVVTGSAGRIGSKLVHALLDAEHSVVGLDLRSTRIDSDRYREIIAAFTDREAVAEAMQDADALLHLGAFMSWVPADADKVWQANVDGTRTVLEAAGDAGVRRVLFASSGEVYPELTPQYLPIDENHPQEPRSIYGLSKKIGEDLVWFHARTRGLDATVLRFSHTQDTAELLDPESFFSGARFFLQGRIRQQAAFGNQANVDLLKPFDDGSEKLLLSCNQDGEPFRMGISETRDIVRGIILSLNHPAAIGKTFNLCPDAPVDFDHALKRMSEITGLPVVTVNFPGPGVRYETSNKLMRDTLGYRPAWTFERMLDEAANVWRGC